MEVKDTNGIADQRKKGQRRIDLFRRENLETWVLIFPPGDVQRMHSHPSDRTYYVLTGRGIMKGRNETHELAQGQIISIPAHEFYEGSNPYDEPMVLLGNSHKATAEDVAKAGGQRNDAGGLPAIGANHCAFGLDGDRFDRRPWSDLEDEETGRRRRER